MKLTAVVPLANFYFFVEIMIQDRADTAAYKLYKISMLHIPDPPTQ